MMYSQISFDVVRKLFEVQVEREEEVERMAPREQQQMTFSHGGEPAAPAQSARRAGAIAAAAASGVVNAGAAPRPASSGDGGAKIGRNDPCPCGSGKKYKKCH